MHYDRKCSLEKLKFEVLFFVIINGGTFQDTPQIFLLDGLQLKNHNSYFYSDFAQTFTDLFPLISYFKTIYKKVDFQF